jgi:ELWxxDGT repeat protein
LVPFQDGWLFSAESPDAGVELWFSNGTASGTRTIELQPGSASSYPGNLVVGDAGAFFFAFDPARGFEPLFTDGTASGTRPLPELAPGPDSAAAHFFAASGDQALLATALADGGTQISLVNAAGQGLNIAQTDSHILEATSMGGAFFWLEAHGPRYALWQTSGPTTTKLVRRWTAFRNENETFWLLGLRASVLFAASDPSLGTEVFETTGADDGGRLVGEACPGGCSSDPSRPSIVGKRLVFSATAPDADREPWVVLLPDSEDTSPPTLEATVIGDHRGEWYVGPTHISFQVDDPESAVDVSGCGEIDVVPEGTSTYTCIASSAGGQTRETVVVHRDTQPPQLRCPGDMTVASADARPVAVPFQVTVTDAVDPAPTLQLPPSNAVYPVGTTTVSAKASDAAGWSSSCEFHITVSRPPVSGQPEPTPETTKLRSQPCGCDTASSVWAGPLVLLWLKRRRRLRAQGA